VIIFISRAQLVNLSALELTSNKNIHTVSTLNTAANTSCVTATPAQLQSVSHQQSQSKLQMHWCAERRSNNRPNDERRTCGSHELVFSRSQNPRNGTTTGRQQATVFHVALIIAVSSPPTFTQFNRV
jgi:hypothetical protein